MRTATEIQNDLDQSADDLRRLRLRNMRLVALALLVAVVGLLVVAQALRARHPAWGYVAAFAEAATIGALADWFAVVALFRRPLGLPIWHTAIIPNSKDDIGRNLGAFVENHFITEDAIARKIHEADPARLIGEWLQDGRHTDRLGVQAAIALGRLLEGLGDAQHEKIRAVLRATVTRQLSDADLSQTVSVLIDQLMQDNRHQQLLDAMLAGASGYLGDADRHPAISEFLIASLGIENSMIKMAINAYIPRTIAALNQTLGEVIADPAHRFRALFDAWIDDFALRLKADPEWAAKIRRHQIEVVNSAQAQQMLDDLWDRIRDKLLRDLRPDDPVLARQAQAWIGKLGRLLVERGELRDWLNRTLESGSAALIRQHRGAAGRFIEQQLAKWTSEEMTQRIELAIGRDLQFIRINGTLVGGLAGLVIHALRQAFG